MKKVIATLVAAMFVLSTPAFAMVEDALPWVEQPITSRSQCGEGHDYGLEGQIAKGTRVKVSISMTAITKDGASEVAGTPVFVAAPQVAALDRDGKLVEPVNGVYKAPFDGVFRVFVKELHSKDYMNEKVKYENYKIRVCPVR